MTMPAVPHPHGWVGTVDQWARGLGIVFAVLELAILFLVWRRTSGGALTPGSRQLLILGLGTLPLIVVFFGYAYGLEASKRVSACGSCHVMTPFVRDLRDPKSDTLAAVHFKNRYIQENHCYTCHTDYGMFGTIRGKWEGLGHVLRYSTGRYRLPIRIAHPYPNARCLACHGESQKFLRSSGHSADVMPDITSGKSSCIDCHGPAHPAPETRAAG
jgi:nitrate/TMAO reductase-like tetraheme cytochrome c subunit